MGQVRICQIVASYGKSESARYEKIRRIQGGVDHITKAKRGSCSGTPAFSNASAVRIQRLPVDSQTAWHWPYLVLHLLAVFSTSSDLFPYENSSRTVPSASMTHAWHRFFPMSIPILFIFYHLLFFGGRPEAASICQDSKSTIVAARVAPFNIKPSKGMHGKGLARHAWWVGGG